MKRATSIILGLALLLCLAAAVAQAMASTPSATMPDSPQVHDHGLLSASPRVLVSVGATLTVTSTADSGPGTLRQALLDAASGDTIVFDPAIFAPTSPATITVTSRLPDLDDGNVTIDASNAGVVLDGSALGSAPETLLLDDISLTLAGGPSVMVNGDFTAGLGHWRPWDDSTGGSRTLNTSDYHSAPQSYGWNTTAHVGGGRTVYDTTDTSDPFAGWPYEPASSVWIPASAGDTAELSFWYRYGGGGVTLRTLFADGREEQLDQWQFAWQANWTQVVFSDTLPTGAVGVALEMDFDHSQAWTDGLHISSAGNVIRGLQVVHFPGDGISLGDGAQDNTIGGDRTLGQGNLVSGNRGNGIDIRNRGAMSNTVQGNIIGLNLDGITVLGNGEHGIEICCDASYNLVGGGTPGLGNLISGNGRAGVQIGDAGTMHNVVQGNIIGLDAAGATALGNGEDGVHIGGGASFNLIGGSNATPGGNCSGQCNLISGNSRDGVALRDHGTVSNTVSGNYIGVDISGTVGIGNGPSDDGVGIRNGPAYNLIGGAAPGQGNLVSGNGDNGVKLDNAWNNVVIGNTIGTDASGMAGIGNLEDGIALQGGAHDNRIGGSGAGEGNLISGNGDSGVELRDGSYSNVVLGNTIGSDANGAHPLANGTRAAAPAKARAEDHQTERPLPAHSVPVDRMPPLELPGLAARAGTGAPPGHSTSVAADRRAAPLMSAGSAAGREKAVPAPVAVPNHGDGVTIDSGAMRNTIGVSNTIAFNQGAGVRVKQSTTVSNTITRNSIYANAGPGIALEDGGNNDLAPPRLASVDLAAGTVSGTACPNCTVEIFSAGDEEGRIFEGETVADGAGNFAFARGTALTGPYITATATDAAGNTSPFAPLYEVLWVDLGPNYSEDALRRLGVAYTRVAVADFASANLADYDVLFVGSTNEPVPDDVYQPLLDRQADIAAYVQAGGGLVALSNGGDWRHYSTPLDWAWVPVTVTLDSQTRRTHIISPTHPLVEGLTDASLLYWWGTHGEAFATWQWPQAVSLVQAAAGDYSALLAGPYGAGRMALTGMFPDVEQEGDPLLRALLDWAAGLERDEPLHVVRAYPEPGGNAAPDTRLRLWFDQLIDPATVSGNELAVVADSGPVSGSLTFLPDLAQMIFTPDAALTPGEQVTATLAATLADYQGNYLDGDGDGSGADPFIWQFNVRAGSVLTVTSAADDGPGTLRAALKDALPGDTITFDPAIFPPTAKAPVTITLAGELPPLDAGYVTVDASDAGVVIDAASARWEGLGIHSDGNVVRGLTIVNAPGAGLDLSGGAAYNLIGGDRTVGNGPNGQGNTVGFSGDWGVTVRHGGTISNTLLGNHIGTDPSGVQAWPNGLNWGGSGLFLELGADYTVVGSNVPGQRNLLSGNRGDGLDINESYYVSVVGNYLGTDASGLAALPNDDCGLDLQRGSRYSRFEGNVFSGNTSCGAQTDDLGTGYNEFVDNYFGVDAAGTGTLPNNYGLSLFDRVEETLVQGNVFANNRGGVAGYGHNNVYRDNFIGTDPTGTATWRHQGYGLLIIGRQDQWWQEDSYDNLVEGNVVANGASGVMIYDIGGARVDGNTLSENSIYDNDDDGIALFGNANQGILPPVITSVNKAAGDASGTACVNCTVEVFSDAAEEGRWYEGETVADGLGNWAFSKGSPFVGPFVQATATDAAGNTSEFSGPPPIVHSVNPTSTVPGTSNLFVTVVGQYFRDNEPLTVDFGAGTTVHDVKFQSPEQIELLLDVDSGAALGPRNVTVTNYDGQSGSLIDGFEIVSIPPPPPVVTAAIPSQVAPGASGYLFIQGSGFINMPALAISGGGIVVQKLGYDGPERLTAQVSIMPTATLGLRDVTVTNPDGQSDTLIGGLTVVTPTFSDEAPGQGLGFSSGEFGAAWGDLDGDNWLDLAIGDGSLYTSTLANLNDATAAAGLDPIGGIGGVSWADYDNDDDLDLLSNKRKVYRQNSLPFTKVWDGGGNQASLAWADYDVDGDVDVYADGRLYRYEGSDTFVDVTLAAGLTPGDYLSSVWADYDDDGDPDLHLACNGCPNILYRNNGDGTFTDVSATTGVNDAGSGHGAAWGDYDNDGDFDLFVANNNGEFSVLYRNDGGGVFTDVSLAAGLHDRMGFATGCNWLDYDLDGWLDLFVVNRNDHNRLYRNNGMGGFVDMGMAAGVADPGSSEGSTVGDYDNDGDPDIFVVGSYGTTPNMLFENHTLPAAGGPHWLKVRLQGLQSNHAAIGARVRVYAGGLMQTRLLAGSTGYLSQDALEALFGLGSHGGPVTVEVTWPSGVVTTVEGVSVDESIQINEPPAHRHDIAVIAINKPKPVEASGSTIIPRATIRNLGSANESHIPVWLRVEVGSTLIYSQTVHVASLNSLMNALVAFPAFTFGAPGGYTFTFTAMLPGDQDSSNDQMSITVDVSEAWVDIWTKDYPGDTGSVPTPSWWQSPDIWVRHANDGGLMHQQPIEGVVNYVYVRVRNRGNVTATNVNVDVFWHEPSLGIICADWAYIGTANIAALPPLASSVVVVPWTPTRSGHTCLYDVVRNPQDPVTFPCDVPGDNNIEQRNVDILANPGTARDAKGLFSIDTATFQVTNVFMRPASVDINVTRGDFPLAGDMLLTISDELFDRWWAAGGQVAGGQADPASRVITLTDAVSATVQGLPMFAQERVTATLELISDQAADFTIEVTELIDGQAVGGNVYLGHTCQAEDLNCDDKVDVLDIQSAATSWNNAIGDADYNVWADFDQNGIIDILDVMHVVASWTP